MSTQPEATRRKKTATPDASLSAEAYSVVRQRILRGEVGIGQVISRRKIAAELGMSFLPVSEALLRLEVEGLLESRPRAGTRVRIPTRQDIRGHYVVREVLEVQAAKLFAEMATPEERAELRKLAERVDAMRDDPKNDRILYLTLHEKLHRRIAECGRCPALCDAIEKTHALASTWLCVAHPEPGENTPQGHAALLDVLSQGDPVAAGEAMRLHISRSMERALKRLSPYFRLRKTCGKKYSRGPNKQEGEPEAVNH